MSSFIPRKQFKMFFMANNDDIHDVSAQCWIFFPPPTGPHPVIRKDIIRMPDTEEEARIRDRKRGYIEGLINLSILSLRKKSLRSTTSRSTPRSPSSAGRLLWRRPVQGHLAHAAKCAVALSRPTSSRCHSDGYLADACMLRFLVCFASTFVQRILSPGSSGAIVSPSAFAMTSSMSGKCLLIASA